MGTIRNIFRIRFPLLGYLTKTPFKNVYLQLSDRLNITSKSQTDIVFVQFNLLMKFYIFMFQFVFIKFDLYYISNSIHISEYSCLA